MEKKYFNGDGFEQDAGDGRYTEYADGVLKIPLIRISGVESQVFWNISFDRFYFSSDNDDWEISTCAIMFFETRSRRPGYS